MRRHLFRSLVLALPVLTLSCGGGSGGGEPSGPQPGIVFTSKRANGFHNLWRMGPTGTGQVALTSVLFDEIAPALDSAGSQVAFVTKRYGLKNQVAVLDVETGTVTRVVPDTFGHSAPTWSPDGAWIAFIRHTNDGTDALYRIHPDGSGLELLKATNSSDPAWSPNGTYIVYVGAGDALRRHTVGSGTDTTIVSALSMARPAWSPDGNKIAFECPTAGICLRNPDGSGAATIPNVTPGATQVGWSSDGIYLLYSRNIDTTGFAPNYELFRIRPDGTDLMRLTTNGDLSGGAVDGWPSGGVILP